MRGLEAVARRALDHRLLCDSSRPVAVALSGGGDSLALALLTDAWAREAGRELVILTVDHRLQTAGAAWVEACAATAARLGRRFEALAWEGAKPSAGLPAAARHARHRLLALAAREAGARVVLLGHTADDILETRAMRAAGATTPEPREWAPSPAWPEGRGVFLLRPLLDARRADIRTWLSARGAAWIEDPANTDSRYARARARRHMDPDARPDRVDPPPLELARDVREAAGVIAVARDLLRGAEPDDARRLVALASVCAGGGARRPAGARIARAAEALRGASPLVTTLAGARIAADAAEIRFFREAGEAGRGGLAALAPTCGQRVWDGRFELAATGEVRRLAGLAGRLPKDQQRALLALPAAARGALPVVVADDGAVSCPVLSGGARSLVGERLRAAAGLVGREPAD